ncbi:MAG TPA: hypothetical protein EYH22_03555, partial [Candidatus Nanopusillus sp.]|nr:hypothetical protein [Candidatus Nanopusillus sp.]
MVWGIVDTIVGTVSNAIDKAKGAVRNAANTVVNIVDDVVETITGGAVDLVPDTPSSGSSSSSQSSSSSSSRTTSSSSYRSSSSSTSSSSHTSGSRSSSSGSSSSYTGSSRSSYSRSRTSSSSGTPSYSSSSTSSSSSWSSYSSSGSSSWSSSSSSSSYSSYSSSYSSSSSSYSSSSSSSSNISSSFTDILTKQIEEHLSRYYEYASRIDAPKNATTTSYTTSKQDSIEKEFIEQTIGKYTSGGEQYVSTIPTPTSQSISSESPSSGGTSLTSTSTYNNFSSNNFSDGFPHTCYIDPSENSKVKDIIYEDAKVFPEEKRAVVGFIESNVGSIPRVERIYKVGPGQYVLIDATGTKWEVDITGGEIRYVTPHGYSRTIYYTENKRRYHKKLIEYFEHLVEEYEKLDEDLKKRIEEYNKRVEEYNKLLDSIDPSTISEEELQKIIEQGEALEKEKQKLMEETERLDEMYEELMNLAPQYAGAKKTINLYDALSDLTSEERKIVEDPFLEQYFEQLEKERKAQQLAYEKFKEQISEFEEKSNSWIYLLPGFSSKYHYDKFNTILEKGFEELRQEIKDPDLLMRTEKYYRNLSSQALKDLDKEAEKTMLFEFASTMVGFGTSKLAGTVLKGASRFIKVGSKGLKKIKIPEWLKLAGTEYVMDVTADILLQKSIFGATDLKSTLLYNLIDFVPIHAKFKDKVERALEIEEFKFKKIDLNIKNSNLKNFLEKLKDIKSNSRATLETIEFPGGKIETGIDGGNLYRKMELKDKDGPIEIKEVRPPEELIQMQIKFKDSDKWYDVEHIVVKKDQKSSLGILIGEIEVDVGKQKQKVKIEEPIKITVHENAEVFLVHGPYKYTIPESPLPYPKTGKLLEVETRVGKEFYDLEIKKAYNKYIFNYKAVGGDDGIIPIHKPYEYIIPESPLPYPKTQKVTEIEAKYKKEVHDWGIKKTWDDDKGMTVVYDPKKKRGFGLDPEMVLEKQMKKESIDIDSPGFLLPRKLKIKVDIDRKRRIPLKNKKAPIHSNIDIDIELPREPSLF